MAGTFPNNVNTVNISGIGVTSNQTVTSTDPTAITITTQLAPNIRITKNDADNLDDTQQVLSGNTATFTIVATNIGTEALTNVTITDPLADSCNRTNTQTPPLYAL